MHNSFLDTSAAGKKILVIVPHEDDEINVAGSMMYSYVQKGAEVYCVFTTNGDYSFWAKTRMQEAANSLHTLGVQQIIFLGYGDTSNHYRGGHLFYSLDKAVTSPAGHQETYGTADYPDYAYTKRGQHSPYDRRHFKQDLQDIILDLQAEIIFCVDYDYHADHRAASLIFEEIMGDILRRPGNTYRPLVFKGFAYCTAFSAAKDFYDDINILSVAKPEQSKGPLIDKSGYLWDDRVRFPVLPACREHFLRQNILYKALFQHKSQYAGLHAIQIANGDTVFWQRRTDNLVYQAQIRATSGDVSKISDFKILDTNNIDDKQPVFANYLWQPAAEDTEKKIFFHWEQPQNISVISLWGRIEDKENDAWVTLTFDTGYTCDIKPSAYGRKKTVVIPAQKGVRCCSLQFHSDNPYSGLSEIGLYTAQYQEAAPFIKMQINEQFAYEYLLPVDRDTCQLGCYQFGTDLPVEYQVVQGNSMIDKTGQVHFAPGESAACIRAILQGHPEVYDEILVQRLSAWQLNKLRFLQKAEKILLNFYLKKYRKYTHVRHKYFKKL